MSDLILSVTDFVALLNQTLEFAYPSVVVVGELANFRVSKDRWVYFDLIDENASVKFFATIHQLPGPLEDGLTLQVKGLPRLHPQYGFSVNVQFMSVAGKGSIKKAAALLEAKLRQEGLFDVDRKRVLPYVPQTVGLITSQGSAAYHDFIKIMNERWSGITIELADVQVQGEAATQQIIEAIGYFNTHSKPVDVLVITRGGGSPEDLSVFSSESVTRAVAGSRLPTLVAIGHEIDISLAELAADKRASTPSNAAQLLVPDKHEITASLRSKRLNLWQAVLGDIEVYRQAALNKKQQLIHIAQQTIDISRHNILSRRQTLLALSPAAVLRRGYTILRQREKVVTSSRLLETGPTDIKFADGQSTVYIRREPVA